jgi:hypothetical protein
MSDRTAELERKIDREAAGALTLSPQPGGAFAIAPRSMGEVMEFAKLMAISGVCVRPVFRGNPGACLAIAVQAMKWGADPFAVANKAYVVKNRSGEETIAYEAQLIHAIVNASPALLRRLRPVYEGDGQERRCRIVGWVKGESEPLEYQSPPVRAIAVKNSPLWQGDPDQQLFYYSTRAWARRHLPEILLGIYAQDEFHGETLDHEPRHEVRREDYSIPAEPVREVGPEFAVVDLDGVENIYGSAGAAGEAMRICLDEAARLGPERLDGWWEDNQNAVEFLRAAGFRQAADEVARAYEAQRRPKQTPTSSVVEEEGYPGSLAPRRARQPRATEVPAPEPPVEDAPPVGIADDDPFFAEVDHHTPAEAPPPISNAQDADKQVTNAQHEIAPPLKAGKRDWRTWALALFGVKVKRCASSNELADLLGANEQNLADARAALAPADLGELERIIAEQWQKLPA